MYGTSHVLPPMRNLRVQFVIARKRDQGEATVSTLRQTPSEILLVMLARYLQIQFSPPHLFLPAYETNAPFHGRRGGRVNLSSLRARRRGAHTIQHAGSRLREEPCVPRITARVS